MSESSFGALAEVLQVLRRPDIPHMLVGAFSSNAYGYPRSTNDVDNGVKVSAASWNYLAYMPARQVPTTQGIVQAQRSVGVDRETHGGEAVANLVL